MPVILSVSLRSTDATPRVRDIALGDILLRCTIAKIGGAVNTQFFGEGSVRNVHQNAWLGASCLALAWLEQLSG
jgi:hypothetical protein